MFPVKLALVALLVGCGGAGVIIEVDTRGLGVETVELVLSDRVCKDPTSNMECVSIQAPQFTTGLGMAGEIFVRDASAKLTVDGELARFEIPADDNRIRMGFAIGRDAQGEIVGSAVMNNTLDLSAGPIVYRVALDPTKPFHDRQPPPEGFAGSAQWGAGRCVGLLPLRTNGGQRPFFILPVDDLDCDGRLNLENGECNPLWFDGQSLDEETAEHCVQQSMVISGAPCVIGHIPCVEADVDTPSCIEQAVCVPDAVCTECATDDTACQNLLLASQNIATRIDCQIPASVAVDSDLGTSCVNDSTFFIDATSIPFLAPEASCTSAQFVKTATMAIGSDLSAKAELDTAKIEITDVSPACEIRMRWDGTIADATISTLHTVLVVQLDVPGGSREVWLPINFAASSACAEPGPISTCAFALNGEVDAIQACVQ